MKRFHDIDFFTLVRSGFIFLTLLVCGNKVYSQDTLWYGHVAFGEGRYDDAINAYQAAIDQGSTWDWLPDLIQTVRIRKDLGNIFPADTHKIAMIFITELKQVSDTGTTTSSDVSARQKYTWHVHFNVFKKTLESFSNGVWTVSIDSLDAVASYRTGATLSPDNPDHLNLEEFFFDRMSDFDSFITFSNTRSPAFGLARTYPYVRGVLYGPHRGMAQINAGNHGYDVLLHEFFHIVEWVSGVISPAHGFLPENRDEFLGWTGTTEFDYYRWHFATTLPGVGWQRLNHRTRWIPFENNRNNFDSLQNSYMVIPLENRQTADTLVNEGNALRSSHLAGAVSKWEEAVALSPYHVEGLLELHDHYRFIADDTTKTKEAYDKLKFIRSVNDFYTLDTLNKSLGKVVGLWHREDISENDQFFVSWIFVSWDVSKNLSQSGSYSAAFYYTHGFKALEIDSVSILEDGAQISLDAHKGVSGNVKTNNVYALSVPEFKPSSLYQLKAKIKGGGGVDSYGQVHLLRTGPTTSVESSSQVPETYYLSQNYPNPFNPSTSIRFNIPAMEFVSLTVHNVLGQLVDVLVNEVRSPGSYTAPLDATGLPSGVYFYRLQAGNFMGTKKFLLLR